MLTVRHQGDAQHDQRQLWSAKMRKKAKEYEGKWDGDRPQATQEKCGIFGVYLEELTVDGAWGSALEGSAAAEIFKVSVVMFTKERERTCSTRAEPRTRSSLKIHMKHWTVLVREDMPEKVTAAKNVPALSSEQPEQIDKMANADTKGMRGGSRTRRRVAEGKKGQERPEHGCRKCHENEES